MFYRVHDIGWNDWSGRFETVEAAKAWIQNQLDTFSDCARTDFVIYRMERVDE